MLPNIAEWAADAVREHVERWANTTDRRMRAAHPNRPYWDECRRRLFVEELERNVPGLSESDRMAVLAEFESAVRRAVVVTRDKPPLALPGRVSVLVGARERPAYRVKSGR